MLEKLAVAGMMLTGVVSKYGDDGEIDDVELNDLKGHLEVIITAIECEIAYREEARMVAGEKAEKRKEV